MSLIGRGFFNPRLDRLDTVIKFSFVRSFIQKTSVISATHPIRYKTRLIARAFRRLLLVFIGSLILGSHGLIWSLLFLQLSGFFVGNSAGRKSNNNFRRAYVARGRAPFGQHEESRPLGLGRSNTGSPRFTDFPSICACSESSLTNLIGWEYETNSLRMVRKLDLPRGHDSWCWTKRTRPLGTRMWCHWIETSGQANHTLTLLQTIPHVYCVRG